MTTDFMGLTTPRCAKASFVIILALLPSSLPAFGQKDAAASLRIRFAKEASRFHVGEVISVELAFSSTVGGTYVIDTRNYDRSGRLDMEQFHLSPQGRDPLHNYYNGGLFGAFIGGGLGGSRYLTSKSHIIREDLNEWMAL